MRSYEVQQAHSCEALLWNMLHYSLKVRIPLGDLTKHTKEKLNSRLEQAEHVTILIYNRRARYKEFYYIKGCGLEWFVKCCEHVVSVAGQRNGSYSPALYRKSN